VEQPLERPTLTGPRGLEHGPERFPQDAGHRRGVAFGLMKKLLILAILITLGAVAARKLRDV
jgi:hypothetical protein